MPPQPNSPSSVCGASTSTRCQASIIAAIPITAARRADRQPPEPRQRPGSVAAHGVPRAVLAALGIGLVLLVARRSAVVAGLRAARRRGGAARRARAAASLDPRHEQAARAGALRGSSSLVALAALLVRRPDARRRRSSSPPRRSGCRSTSAARTSSASPRSGALGRLLPLYLVLGAAALALRLADRSARSGVRPLPRDVAWPAAAFLAFAVAVAALVGRRRARARTCSSSSCSRSRVLVAVVAPRAVPAPGCRACSASIVVALAIALRGGRDRRGGDAPLLFHSPAVEVANAYSNFFRVTSLFRDPSLYGRHVVLGIAIAARRALVPRREPAR